MIKTNENLWIVRKPFLIKLSSKLHGAIHLIYDSENFLYSYKHTIGIHPGKCVAIFYVAMMFDFPVVLTNCAIFPIETEWKLTTLIIFGDSFKIIIL